MGRTSPLWTRLPCASWWPRMAWRGGSTGTKPPVSEGRARSWYHCALALRPWVALQGGGDRQATGRLCWTCWPPSSRGSRSWAAGCVAPTYDCIVATGPPWWGTGHWHHSPLACRDTPSRMRSQPPGSEGQAGGVIAGAGRSQPRYTPHSRGRVTPVGCLPPHTPGCGVLPVPAVPLPGPSAAVDPGTVTSHTP